MNRARQRLSYGVRLTDAMTRSVHFSAISTARLRLEPVREAHAESLLEPLQSPALYRFTPDAPPTSLEALSKRYRFLQGARSPDGSEHWLNWVVFPLDGGVPAGTMQATVRPGQSSTIGYLLFPGFWRSGIGREAVAGMVDYLFDRYTLHEISASIDTRNVRSLRLVEALGFVFEETTRDADFFNGETSHEHRYCTTPHQWRKA